MGTLRIRTRKEKGGGFSVSVLHVYAVNGLSQPTLAEVSHQFSLSARTLKAIASLSDLKCVGHERMKRGRERGRVDGEKGSDEQKGDRGSHLTHS